MFGVSNSNRHIALGVHRKQKVCRLVASCWHVKIAKRWAMTSCDAITMPVWMGLNWNDWRSRRVFLCFYSAIFKLTSAKFQTFACNSRTVRSSNMKFWQQFEINELHVRIKLRGNRSRDFCFRTRKPSRKFGVKSGLSQKRLKYGKKYFIWLYVLRYLFIPTNPVLAMMRFISFFSFFFLFSLFFPFFSS